VPVPDVIVVCASKAICSAAVKQLTIHSIAFYISLIIKVR